MKKQNPSPVMFLLNLLTKQESRLQTVYHKKLVRTEYRAFFFSFLCENDYDSVCGKAKSTNH